MEHPKDLLSTALIGFRELVTEGPRREELAWRLGDFDALCAPFAHDPHVQMLYATALIKLGRIEDACAVAAATRRLARTPLTAQTVCRVLRAAAGTGFPVSRLEDALEPDDLEIWLEGGRELGERSCFPEATRWFEHVLVREPDHVHALALRAYVRWLLDIEPEHTELVRSLAQQHPDDPLLAQLTAEMEAT